MDNRFRGWDKTSATALELDNLSDLKLVLSEPTGKAPKMVIGSDGGKFSGYSQKNWSFACSRNFLPLLSILLFLETVSALIEKMGCIEGFWRQTFPNITEKGRL